MNLFLGCLHLCRTCSARPTALNRFWTLHLCWSWTSAGALKSEPTLYLHCSASMLVCGTTMHLPLLQRGRMWIGEFLMSLSPRWRAAWHLRMALTIDNTRLLSLLMRMLRLGGYFLLLGDDDDDDHHHSSSTPSRIKNNDAAGVSHWGCSGKGWGQQQHHKREKGGQVLQPGKSNTPNSYSVSIIYCNLQPANNKQQKSEVKMQKAKTKRKSKRTTPGIPTWSPTVVLTWPDSA